MMRLLAIALLVCAPSLLLSAETAKPNILSSKQIGEGWLLLFDGETLFGWKTDSGVAVDSAMIRLPAGKQIQTTTRFSARELELESSVDGKDWQSSASKADQKSGSTPITIDNRSNGPVFYRNIKLRPQYAKPIFNAKNLDGWKVYPGPRYKSVFTVTPEGWLNVRNGPGDLQTVKQYDDFILQLECISNGKGLNSGIFFRCIADQYQNGYEAQIHNGYKGNDRTKPTDFGTGAIYRRVAARKVVANDREWFTLTIAAQGNHIATWVNGYQTADWTDERPADDNPRKGSKTGAGHLSIQGHDPTTDLSFRNIRIIELIDEKKPKN